MNFYYAAGTAGYVRGEQIADYLGANKNPKKHNNDLSVYVKVIPPEDHSSNSYIDVDDSVRAAEYLKDHPEFGVIATSQLTKDYLTKYLGREDIHLIPHAHCNYERWIRPKRPIKVVGIIGSKTTFQYPIDEFKKRLAKLGLELRYDYEYWDTYRSTPDKPGRLKVVEFYKGIDVQVCWRPKMYAKPFKNPNKIINAASFGIPTIAHEEDGFKEWHASYWQAKNINHLISHLETSLKWPSMYYSLSSNICRRAEDYHIDNISKLYRKL